MKTLFALFLAVALPVAAALPTEITAEYDITSLGGFKIGRVVETYARKGDRYSAESVTRSEGALKVFLDDQVRIESSGSVNAAGLKPERFTQKRARDGKRDIDATFDWTRGLLVSRVGDETKEIALAGDTQDRLSLMYQFMHLAPRDAGMAISMSNGRKVETYNYRFVERVKVVTPAGEFDTLHYARITEGKESHADIWLAAERFNFPVRLVFDDNRGLRLEQTLVSLQSK
jgi:hypothetical protein